MSYKSKTMHLSLSKKLHRAHNCPGKKEPSLKETVNPGRNCCLNNQAMSCFFSSPAPLAVLEVEGEGYLEPRAEACTSFLKVQRCVSLSSTGEGGHEDGSANDFIVLQSLNCTELILQLKGAIWTVSLI